MPHPLRIVFFGTYDERLHPRVRVLREGLAACGHDVTIVNEPLGVDTEGRVQLAAQPWRAPVFIARLAAAWARLLCRSRRARQPDVVVVGYLGHFDIHVARFRWPRTQLVLDQMISLSDTVRDRGLDRAAPVVRLLELIDRAATAQADTVVVDTPQQAALIAPQHRSKVVVVPVGAPSAWFDARYRREKHPETVTMGQTGRPLRVVFFGLFTPLQGAPTIGQAIGKLGDRNIIWTMIGKGQERMATEAATDSAKVSWLDWVDAEELPSIVAGHDVCLGIFGTGAKALRVVPNKVYQGAAAGCAVVTSDTPSQRSALGEAALYTPPGDAEALAHTIAGLAGDRALLAGRRQAAANVASRAFTPSTVVASLAEVIERAHDDAMSHKSRAQPPLPPNAALRWHLVDQHVRAVAPATILECGAGQGAVSNRLCRVAEYVGIEPDATSRATAASRVPEGTRLLADIDELDDDETFDLLCAFEVLEHIEDDKGVLAHWIERVRPGGHVLVSVPADPERFAVADELAGHFRRYSVADLSALFASAGLTTESVEHYGFPLGLALEAGRNRIARRRLAADDTPPDIASRTARSGRHLQPPTWMGTAIWWGTGPFRHIQRRFPERGPGLVGLARRPT